MTFDEYVDCVQTAAVLFGQRFTRPDLERAYHHATWLADVPARTGHSAVSWLEAHHSGRLTLAALHTALRARASVHVAGSKVLVGPDGAPDWELTEEWEARNRHPDRRRRPGGPLDQWDPTLGVDHGDHS